VYRVQGGSNCETDEEAAEADPDDLEEVGDVGGRQARQGEEDGGRVGGPGTKRPSSARTWRCGFKVTSDDVLCTTVAAMACDLPITLRGPNRGARPAAEGAGR
jgi:hypothetical protein